MPMHLVSADQTCLPQSNTTSWDAITVSHLSPAEHVVLLPLRRRMEVGECTPHIANAYWLAFGPARVEQALAALETLVLVIDSGARRQGCVLATTECRVSFAERGILELVGCCQRGHTSHAAALCSWLVLARYRLGLLHAALDLGAELMHKHFQLPIEESSKPGTAAM